MADPWWLPGCLQNIAKIPHATLCPQNHCDSTQTYWDAVCNCQDPYLNGCSGPNPPQHCCTYTATSPIAVFGSTVCYCCCGCMANHTQISITDTVTKEIQEIEVGDTVMVAKDASLKSWIQLPVQMSAGTGPDALNTLLRIHFGDPENPESVIVTRDQLFLQPGQKFVRAAKLVPHRDVLVRPDNSTVPVLDLTVGQFKLGVHQISTSSKPTIDPAGHLLIANGVVCGDYSLQITDLDEAKPALMVDDHKARPEFGTKAYVLTHTHLAATTLKAHAPGTAYKPRVGGGFEALEAVAPMAIPDTAVSFVTAEQAADIEKNAPRSSILSGAGRDITNYLFKLYKGFYPSTVFYLDEGNDDPQAYSFMQLGVPFVVVNGGLIRTDCVQYEALAFVIAHQLAAIYGGEPEDSDGYSCTGQADYAAILAIFPYVWFGYYAAPMMQPAIDQIGTLFGFIDPKHSGGTPGDKCVDISIACRQSAMVAASQTMPLPECAGGPQMPTLEVIGAAGKALLPPSVIISFNEALDPVTAVELGNYEFDPLTPTVSVELQPDQKSVVVQGDFHAVTKYTVTVESVLSKDGDPLVKGKNTAHFTLPTPPTPKFTRR